MRAIQNYHRHSSYSNIFTTDSAATNEDYAKRAVELGHKVISSVEHGWQSNYHECFELAQKYDLKFVFGSEVYWVKDRQAEYPVIDKTTGEPKKNKDGTVQVAKDRTNCHMVLLAKTEKGRRAINAALSEANETGYYYRPRLDLELIFSLPPEDVMVTSACIAGWLYEDMDEIILKLRNHFKDNFYLEIQYHPTDKQIELNKRIKRLSHDYIIPMIVGLDSHFIYPEQAEERDYLLKSKGVVYEDESEWFMDYPDDDTVMQRFLDQGVFSREEIQQAMDNTDVLLTFDDYSVLPDGSLNPIFSKEIKLPTLYDGKHEIDGVLFPKLTQEERNSEYSRLITKLFKKYMKGIPKEEYDEYFEGVKNEVSVIKETNMSDYFLLDYYIVKKAIEMGGVLTNTGRGSAVSYLTNTLLGFSKVDRFQAPIKLYPERFISKSRILEANSLPDIDMNWGTPEIAEEAQKIILGEDHVYPMIAFGTAKKKSAFKMYAKSQDLDFNLANEISRQIEKYDEALKHAEDGDDINIYDYVDEKYHSYIDESQKYWGIITDKKKHACGYLMYNGDIREEIGLIKCKSESTKKEYITTVVDGAVAEKYKFLKNDDLKVDTVLLTDLVYKRIGIKPHTVNELTKLVENDKKVWDLYASGLTIGVNQCEREQTMKKLKRYKPKNISELTAFIAAIRPGFKSMYSKFESKENFSYGIPAFDKLIQTEQFPYSFIMYQEQTMNTLNYAGFPMDQCYSIIKDIAKKHPEKVKPLRQQFIDGFTNRIMHDDNVAESEAKETSEKVWQIINDSSSYSFNSSHAYCMALDSLYNAWQKAHYPYEFYEVLLQTFSDKGKKDKVAELKKEMLNFGIEEGRYAYGLDNRRFKADQENHVIYPALTSIKGLSQSCANDLYSISQNNLSSNFSFLYKTLKTKRSLDSKKINILIEIGYFDDFGSIAKIKKYVDGYDVLHGKSQFRKDKLPAGYEKIIKKYSAKETEKLYKEFDYDSALTELWDSLEDEKTPLPQKLAWELEHFGYIKTLVPKLDLSCYYIIGYECKYKNPTLTMYRLADGKIETVKVRKSRYDNAPIHVGDIIRVVQTSKEGKWSKDENGEWVQDKTNKDKFLKRWNFMK